MNTTETTVTKSPEQVSDSLLATPCDTTTIVMGDSWETENLVSLVRRNTTPVFQPKLLMLGEREAAMLREHLAQAFGADQVLSGLQLFYIGMKVVEIRVPSLVKVAGEKLSPQMERIAHNRTTFERHDDSIWSLRVR